MHIKNISKVTFQDLRSVCIKAIKLAIDDIFYILDGTSHLYCMYILKKLKKILVNLDAIKASVPKFLNFLGAELNNKCITHFEGKPLLLAENNDLNQISKKFIYLPKIRFKVIIWIMQKVYFCPEENTKPSDCNCATFYTKIFY